MTREHPLKLPGLAYLEFRAKPQYEFVFGIGTLMRRILALAVFASLVSPAQAAMECGRVTAFEKQRLLEVDGVLYQMKYEKLSKRDWRLIGHDMYFVHSKDANSLIRHGGTTHLACKHGDADEPLVQTAVPYKANTVAQSISTASADDDSSASTRPDSRAPGHGGHGHGGHGGKGGGGGKHK